jgi:hypothetical protein
MSISELAFRARRALQSEMQSRGIGLVIRPPAPDLRRFGAPWISEWPTRDQNLEAVLAAADAVLAGRFNVFAMPAARLGFPPQWNRDPRTGVEAPLSFGVTLNYRDDTLVGDIKYLWEPARHLQLVTLAQAWRLSGEARYLAGCRILLESWWEQCPYPLGAHWSSALELAIRLVNWAAAWQLLNGGESPLFEGPNGRLFQRRWLDSVYQHCHFIALHLSRYSSANNHLLGELMGLFIGSLTWPCWSAQVKWMTQAREEFERQALTQNAPDGVNREQAVYYQHEVVDMMLQCALVGRANHIEFSAPFWERLERMLEFIAGIMDCNGHVPMIGDADDAVIVRLDPSKEFDPYKSLLATGAVLFGRSDFKEKAGRFDAKSRWLLGEQGALRFDALEKPAASLSFRRAFPEGGYYILGDAFGTEREIRLVADVAPLGYLSIAAHGHADALAFTLALGGKEMLIDPGTFAYHSQSKWRDYFRGTSAHNTLRVDGENQSVIGGNFMWLRHAKATCEVWEPGADQERLVGSHDGYMRLRDPVRHRREIVLDKRCNVLRIMDMLECRGRHIIELYWHCHEEGTVTIVDGTVEVRRAGTSLALVMKDSRFTPRLARGEESEPLGWVSRGFDQKTETGTIIWTGEIAGNVTLCTEITVNPVLA